MCHTAAELLFSVQISEKYRFVFFCRPGSVIVDFELTVVDVITANTLLETSQNVTISKTMSLETTGIYQQDDFPVGILTGQGPHWSVPFKVTCLVSLLSRYGHRNRAKGQGVLQLQRRGHLHNRRGSEARPDVDAEKRWFEL